MKAHDEASCRLGCPKARGNDAVDGCAKASASSASCPLYVPDPRGEDTVQLQDAAGVWLRDVTGALTAIWWEVRRAAATRRRPWLATLYPAGMAFDWSASTHIFRNPLVESGKFVHFADPPVLKWVARARSGALVSSDRFARTRKQPPPPCPCCGAPLEDDLHMVSGCPATGSGDCAAFVAALWVKCNQARGAGATALPPDWVAAHLPQLAVALIPADLAQFSSPSELWPVSFILRDFHIGMARWLAERLRRREQIVGTALAARSSQLPQGAAVPAPPEVQAFQLTVAELRAAERSPAAPPAPALAVPGRAAFRQSKQQALMGLASWVKSQAHLRACPLEDGVSAVALLLLWEVDHGTQYPSQAVELVGRLTTFTKALSTAVAADSELSAWLTSCKATMRLTPGLPISVYRRWSVRIAPEVGEPYLSRWKAHLGEQVRRTSVTVAAGLTGPPVRAKREVKPKAAPQRPKRPREDVPPPPSNSREERVKRLRAAQAAPAVQVAGRRLPLPPPRPTGSPSRGSGPPAASSGPLSALSLSSRSLSLSAGEAGAGAPDLRSPPTGAGAGLAGPQPVAGPGVPPPPTAPT